MSKKTELGCVRVELRAAEEAIKVLRSDGLLARARPRREEGSLLIPVTDPASAVDALSRHGLEAHPCRDRFEGARPRGLPREVGISGFVKVGSVVLFSHSRSLPFDAYVRAAELVAAMYSDVESVFLKLGTVGELRLPQLVLLYGSGSTVTRVRENGLYFIVDIARSYYNPKLSEERLRVARQVSEGEYVLDMFAGVGPFSITTASLAACNVLAVDMNPYAVYLLARNVDLNRKRLRGRVTPLRADSARLPHLIDGEFDRIIMNNPTSVLDFFDVACALAARGAVLHVYLLSTDETTAASSVSEVALRACGQVRVVRSRKALEYSPSKSIYAVDLVVRP